MHMHTHKHTDLLPKLEEHLSKEVACVKRTITVSQVLVNTAHKDDTHDRHDEDLTWVTGGIIHEAHVITCTRRLQERDRA